MVASDKLKNIQGFSNSLTHGLFASRESTKEAINYAYDLIDTLDVKDRSVAYTSLHVVLNSVSDELNRLAK
jgi:hypothetical protein